MPGPREKYNDLTLNTPAGAQLRNAQRRGIEKEGSDFLEMSRTFILFIQGSPFHKIFGTQGFNIQVSRQSHRIVANSILVLERFNKKSQDPQPCGVSGKERYIQEQSRPTVLWNILVFVILRFSQRSHSCDSLSLILPEVHPVEVLLGCGLWIVDLFVEQLQQKILHVRGVMGPARLLQFCLRLCFLSLFWSVSSWHRPGGGFPSVRGWTVLLHSFILLCRSLCFRAWSPEREVALSWIQGWSGESGNLSSLGGKYGAGSKTPSWVVG